MHSNGNGSTEMLPSRSYRRLMYSILFFSYVESKLHELHGTTSLSIVFQDILPPNCNRSVAAQAFLQTLCKSLHNLKHFTPFHSYKCL
jgi:hypothetical protein